MRFDKKDISRLMLKSYLLVQTGNRAVASRQEKAGAGESTREAEIQIRIPF